MRTLTKVILICAHLFICLSNLTFSQAPDTMWTKHFGIGIATSVEQTIDSGYIIGGDDNQTFTSKLIKTDTNGEIEWSKSLGFTLRAVKQTSDSGYAVVGYSGNQSKLVKTDQQGDIIWDKTYYGVNRRASAVDFDQTEDNGFIITGSTEIYNVNAQPDIFLIKTNQDGDTLWTKIIGYEGIFEIGRSIRRTLDGGYIIAGSIYGYTIKNWLIKTNSLGDTLWTKTFNVGDADNCQSVRQTNDGGYILTGWTYPQTGSETKVWLYKTNEIGNMVWSGIYHGDRAGSYCVEQTMDLGYILTGWIFNPTLNRVEVLTIKVDENAVEKWRLVMGAQNSISNAGYAIKQTNDTGYIIVGYSEYPNYPQSDKYYVIKLFPENINSVTTNNLSVNFIINQNYPNPFNPSTTIKYQISNLSFVTIKVYDVLGNELETLISEEKPAGTYEVIFDASNYSSGVYFYRLQAGDFVEIKKMVLMK